MSRNVANDTAIAARAIAAREGRALCDEQVKAAALQTLAACGVTKPLPIDLDRIAASLGAEIAFDDLDGAAARVIRIGDQARIVVSTRITDVGAIRFSIAHEIGHLACKHYVRCGAIERICSPSFVADSRVEQEANMFATELLMPARFVAPWCASVPLSLEPVRAIASACRASMLTSAMRFVELTPEPCAVVYSELGRVRWVTRSRSFHAHIPEGRLIEPAAAAFDYFDRGALDHSSRIVPLGTWIPNADQIGSAMLLEHTTAVTGAGAVFSLLWMPASSRTEARRTQR